MLVLLAALILSLNFALGAVWTACVSTCILTVLMLLLLDEPARRLNLIDHPSGRKTHAIATPLTGGLAILCSLVLMSLIGHHFNPLMVLLTGIAVIGVIDDRYGLSAKSRLLAEAIAALMLVQFAGTGIVTLGNLLGYGPLDLAWLTIPFTALCVVGLINAINMMDGLDGLAAGISATSLAWMLAAVFFAGASPPLGLPLLIAAVTGFLARNARHPLNIRASAFLGDSGSMMLGLALSWYAITLSQGTGRVLSPASILWILGLPVIDTLRVMFRRSFRQGRSPFSAGRDHLHHVAQGLGLSPGPTAWLIVLLNTVFGAIGVLGPQLELSEPVLTYGFLGVAVAAWVFTPESRFIGECGQDVSACKMGSSLECGSQLHCWPRADAINEPTLASTEAGPLSASFDTREIRNAGLIDTDLDSEDHLPTLTRHDRDSQDKNTPLVSVRK